MNELCRLGKSFIHGPDQCAVEFILMDTWAGGAFALIQLQACAAAPDADGLAPQFPDGAFVICAADGAEEKLVQQIFCAVGSFLRQAAPGIQAAPGQLQPDAVVGLSVDNGFVGVLDIIFRPLSVIDCPAVGEAVQGVGFLQDGIACIFLGAENGEDISAAPDGGTVSSGDAPVGHVLCYGLHGDPVCKGGEDLPDDACFLLDDNGNPGVAHAVAEGVPQVIANISFGEFFTYSPEHILGNGFAFGLGKGSVETDDEFRIHLQGVYIFLFEFHTDPESLQIPHDIQQVHGVPGKPADGFAENEIDAALPTFGQETVHLSPPEQLGAGEAFVCKNTHQLPAGGVCYELCVVGNLCLIGIHLIIMTRGYAAISSYPGSGNSGESGICLFPGGNDGDCSFLRIIHHMCLFLFLYSVCIFMVFDCFFCFTISAHGWCWIDSSFPWCLLFPDTEFFSCIGHLPSYGI